MADEANSWSALQGHHVVKRINHQLVYSSGQRLHEQR